MKDIIHDAVRNALVKDGWTITDDPLDLELEDLFLRADLGGERALAAERGLNTIGVEIKSFLQPSMTSDVYRMIGQFLVYRAVLRETDPQRILYIALPRAAYRMMIGTLGYWLALSEI